MNSYEEKQEARRQRLAQRAAKAQAEAQRRGAAADAIASQIPLGQPILVGHHSEKRARRDAERIRSNTQKSIEAHERAAELRSRADAVGSGGISSDDPDAVRKLQAELEQAEAIQARMVAANKLVRKGDHAGLAALGLSEKQINSLFEPDFAGRLGFPDYAIKNNGANIRRIKARIAELGQRREQEATFEPIEGDGWRIYAEDNRVCLSFDQRPPKDRIDTLKHYGFRWAPSRGAWQRHFSEQAIYWAKMIVKA